MSDPVAAGPAQAVAAGAPDPQRSRLRWRCRRGMQELDLLLLAWLDVAYERAGSAQRAAFAALLELPDPQLARYLTAVERPGEAALAELIDAMIAVMSDRPGGTPAPGMGPTGVV